MQIRYVKYKKWAGYKVRGERDVAVTHEDAHIERMLWLVSQLEAPRWGSVQNYDGVGMSGGLLHNIAVYRDGRQATLFPLIRRIEIMSGNVVNLLFKKLHDVGEHGWYVAQDGRLRHCNDGRMVPGNEIVAEFSGPRGLTPRRGAQADNAKDWVELFHGILANPNTFEAQKDYAKDWLLEGHEELESAAYRLITGGRVTSSRDGVDATMEVMGAEADFAMCVYHAFSVNAPGKAKQILNKLMRQKTLTAENMPERMIRAFGTSSYARWKDQPDDKGSRYDNTRIRAVRSKLWPRAVTNKLMPKNL